MSPPRLANDAHLISAFDLLSRPNVPISRLFPLVPGLSDYSPSILERLSIAGLYKQHIIRQNHEVKLYLRDENLRIDESVDYNAMPGMSYEVRQRLNAARPTTLVSPPPCSCSAASSTDRMQGQAKRIEGVTPTSLASLMKYVRSAAKRRGEEGEALRMGT